MASFLITDVRIFDGENSIDHGSVLVQDGRIAQVSSTQIDHRGTTISKPGHTLLPGLIDVHIHADGGNPVALPQSLRFGVTTVCDMHNEDFNIARLRKQIEGGDCADLKTTSFAATIDMGWPMPIVLMHHDTPEVRAEMATWPRLTTPESGRQYVRDRVAEGVDYIKLMHESGKLLGQTFNKPSLELQTAIIDEAHQHGLKAVAHATCLSDTLEILQCGADGLTHCALDALVTDDVIAAYKRNNAHCNPTLAAMGSLTTEGAALQAKLAHDPRAQALMDDEARGRMCACMAVGKDTGKIQHAYDSVKSLKAAGVPILVGSDAASPAVGTAWGLSMHHELALFVNECGFSPAEALNAATALPAARFGFMDRGRIREGMRADLLLVEGNPVEDVDRTLDIRAVWKEGRLCSVYEGKV
ncbi:hypothetical protein LTR62_000687 [Meristemomyces frigidus]|uniref:Amidohydrolase-related domain-containing protein n=1 Tax=Meristemomyces frigidus TaxID=1508187 RepID=A0AAN7T936_9PEZI|nr:hypothetical protein LTR62_000687 [Meristemomyces frigidus]